MRCPARRCDWRNLFALVLAAFLAGWISVQSAAGAEVTASPTAERTRKIPEPLKGWESWATWNEERHRACPVPFNDPEKHFCFWPSRLHLAAERQAGRFELTVTVYAETRVPLPGGEDAWPQEVRANDQPVPVVEHANRPAVRLPAGIFRLAGIFRWSELPPRIALPPQIGLLGLTIDGKPVDFPAWDAQGSLWLRRGGAAEGEEAEAERPFLAIKLHALLEDGIPLWLRTEVELTVSGKSREEDLGTVLPEGWKLAAVESQIPVAVDAAGRMKAQVRAGKWTVRAAAFRLDDPPGFRYPPGAKVAAPEQLVAFRAKPDFRLVEIGGAVPIDVSQTTFPEKWRAFPVYRWDTAAATFLLETRMRGMGQAKPAGLTIAREWWLDENGRGLTFRDRITGARQQIWRLDAAPGQELGSVRSRVAVAGTGAPGQGQGQSQGQLITRNPQNGAPGVEIRTRTIDLDATGRMARAGGLPAAGWRTDADALHVTLNLPPGWRLFALFGADWVRGDWLTAWTLLDLFLLLIFSLAVFRLWGAAAAVLAFLAFALAYHEPGAPRFAWLFLLAPLALLRAVPEGPARRVVVAVKWIALAVLVIVAVPFVAGQVQQALYPQLEPFGRYRHYGAAPSFAARGMFGADADAGNVTAPLAEAQLQLQVPTPTPGESWPRRGSAGASGSISKMEESQQQALKSNLLYDAKTRIQTGPGVPEFQWRSVSFGWNGPVLASHEVRPVLISSTLERAIASLRVILLLALAAMLLRRRKATPQRDAGTDASASAEGSGERGDGGKAAASPLLLVLMVSILVGGLFSPAGASAQETIPSQGMIETLRQRLLERSDAFPHAAEIPAVTLTLTKDRHIAIDAEIHAAVATAVPLPVRLPAFSPLTVTVEGVPEPALRREDESLWVALAAGVHRVRVEGLLPKTTEWEWTFPLKPRQVKIDAPGWNVTGVRPDGVPEAQVFFSLKQKETAPGEATYDRQDFDAVAVVDRYLELGLVWNVRATVSRLSPPGKAIALRVPLLPGESVLSSNATVTNGFLEVRLGAQERSFTWESQLVPSESLKLATRKDDPWVERWHLVASPVWNVAYSGLAPIFETDKMELVPVWHPWPGEAVAVTLSRPEAIAGATVTVHRVSHEIAPGKRQRASTLALSLQCSFGEDFLIGLPPGAEVTSLAYGGKSLPVRKVGDGIIVPLQPGESAIAVAWKINAPLGTHAQAEEVRLPVESANIHTEITVPGDRWILWTHGPLRGPAVRFWVILACSALAALALGRVPHTPLRAAEWMLLVIGLTQVFLPAALVVIGWLFLLAWRGTPSFQRLRSSAYNLLQTLLLLLTFAALGILVAAVGEGLLGHPEMFIRGNDSGGRVLRWYQARSDTLLPQPGCVSVSIWWYRLLMLAWALWLAAALLRWLRWGWGNFSRGGFFRRQSKRTEQTGPSRSGEMMAPTAPGTAAATTAAATPPMPPPLPIQPPPTRES